MLSVFWWGNPVCAHSDLAGSTRLWRHMSKDIHNIIFLYWCFKNDGSFSWRCEAWQLQKPMRSFRRNRLSRDTDHAFHTHTHKRVCNGPLQWSMAPNNCELTGPSLTDASGTASLANTCGLSTHASMAWKVKLSFLQSSDHIHLPSNLILIKRRLWDEAPLLSSALELVFTNPECGQEWYGEK